MHRSSASVKKYDVLVKFLRLGVLDKELMDLTEAERVSEGLGLGFFLEGVLDITGLFMSPSNKVVVRRAGAVWLRFKGLFGERLGDDGGGDNGMV